MSKPFEREPQGEVPNYAHIRPGRLETVGLIGAVVGAAAIGGFALLPKFLEGPERPQLTCDARFPTRPANPEQVAQQIESTVNADGTFCDVPIMEDQEVETGLPVEQGPVAALNPLRLAANTYAYFTFDHEAGRAKLHILPNHPEKLRTTTMDPGAKSKPRPRQIQGDLSLVYDEVPKGGDESVATNARYYAVAIDQVPGFMGPEDFGVIDRAGDGIYGGK